MLKSACVVGILMGCLNGAAHFSSALSETELDTVRGYCQKDGRIEITIENLNEVITRLTEAKSRVEKYWPF